MSQIATVFLLLLSSLFAFAGPGRATYQAKIVKPDGYPLEASSVNFKFTILDPAGTCILYAETYSAVNMASTGGLISFSLGSGVKTYPVSSPTFEDVFSNITPVMSCDAGGPLSYVPASSDTRKIVMQFHDGNGWQTLPAMNINAVPYAMYATSTETFGGVSASAYLRDTEIPTCPGGQALTYNGTTFSCIVSGGGSVSAAAVVSALGYTPADSASFTTVSTYAANVSATVFSVSSTVSSLSNAVTSLENSVASSFTAITSSQWVTSGTTISYGLGNIVVSGGVRISMDASSCSVNSEGTLRYNAGVVEFCNGTTWSAFGVAGSGITLLNGSASGSQTFGTGINGTVFNISSVNGVHTFNIPHAASAGVTAGLISNADFNNLTDAQIQTATSFTTFTAVQLANASSFVTITNSLSAIASSFTTVAGNQMTNAASFTAIASTQAGYSASFAAMAANTQAASFTATSGIITPIIYGSTSPFGILRLESTMDSNKGDILMARNSGNVGLGTGQPLAKLYVDSDGLSPNAPHAGAVAVFDNEASDMNISLMTAPNRKASVYFAHTGGASRGAISYQMDYNPSLDKMTFNVNSASAMTLDAFNRFGLGVVTPQAKLHISAGSATIAPLKFTSGTLLASPQSGTIEYDGFNYYLTTGTNSRRAIATEQGTTNLSTSYLTVSGSLNLSESANLYLSAAGADPGDIIFQDASGTQKGRIWANPSGQGLFLSSGDIVPDISINGSGNVGIGTQSPTEKLEVSGAIKVPGVGQIGPSGVYGYAMYTNGTNNFIGQMYGAASGVQFTNSIGANTLQINETGNVGIGITSATAALSVNSSIGNNVYAPLIKVGNAQAEQNSIGIRSISADYRQGLKISSDHALTLNGKAGASGSLGTAPILMVQSGHVSDETDDTSTVMTILKNGNFGIGTVNPVNTLDIVGVGFNVTRTATFGAVGTFRKAYTATSNEDPYVQYLHQATSGGAYSRYGYIQSGQNHNGMAIQAENGAGSGGNLMLNKFGGSVGVGTNVAASMTAAFNVVGSSVGEVAQYITNTNLAGYSVIRMNNNFSSVASGTALHSFGAGYGAIGDAYSPLTTTLTGFESGGLNLHAHAGEMKFYTNGNLAANNRMTISTTGNVGIGTSGPTVKLHVAGTVDGPFVGLAIDNRKTYGAGTGFNETARMIFSLTENITSAPATRVMGYIEGGTQSETSSADTFLAFGTRSGAPGTESEKMRISSAGYVGIGTSSPAALLNLGGNTATMMFGNGTAETGPYKITVLGSGIATPATKGAGFGRNLVIEAGASDNSSSKAGGDLYLRPGIPIAPSTLYGNTIIADQGGNVGIGTDAPSAKLNITGLGAANGVALRIDSQDTYYRDILMTEFNTTGHGGILRYHSGLDLLQLITLEAGVEKYGVSVARTTGFVGIGMNSAAAYALDVNGDIRITGTPYRASGDVAWTVPSDARLKDVIKNYDRGLKEILNIDTIVYRYKKDNPKKADTSKEFTGVLAQQVQQQIPEAVNEDTDGFLSLNTTPIFWAMINAIKEVYHKVEALITNDEVQNRRIASVEEENKKLKEENAAIKAYLCGKDPSAALCK